MKQKSISDFKAGILKDEAIIHEGKLKKEFVKLSSHKELPTLMQELGNISFLKQIENDLISVDGEMKKMKSYRIGKSQFHLTLDSKLIANKRETPKLISELLYNLRGFVSLAREQNSCNVRISMRELLSLKGTENRTENKRTLMNSLRLGSTVLMTREFEMNPANNKKTMKTFATREPLWILKESGEFLNGDLETFDTSILTIRLGWLEDILKNYGGFSITEKDMLFQGIQNYAGLITKLENHYRINLNRMIKRNQEKETRTWEIIKNDFEAKTKEKINNSFFCNIKFEKLIPYINLNPERQKKQGKLFIINELEKVFLKSDMKYFYVFENKAFYMIDDMLEFYKRKSLTKNMTENIMIYYKISDYCLEYYLKNEKTLKSR